MDEKRAIKKLVKSQEDKARRTSTGKIKDVNADKKRMDQDARNSKYYDDMVKTINKAYGGSK